MAIAEFNQTCNEMFNTTERSKIEKFAEEMFRKDMVEAYLPVGKKEVCLKRESVKEKTVEVFLMNSTLTMNNALVTRFNKRKKTGRQRPVADQLEHDEWYKRNFEQSYFGMPTTS